MADQKVEIRYTKSPLWRVVTANGAAVGGISTPLSGPEIGMRFTVEWLDVENETFRATIDQKAGMMTITQTGQINQGPLYRIEEVAVKMPTEGIVALITALLGQVSLFTPQQKQKLHDEFAKFPKS